ncbi:MAG: GIY-YIG nuclease family protein [Fibrobacterota bacterium]
MNSNPMLDKKDAIKKYKQTIQPMGIFQIKNLTNGKVFIESSKNLPGSQNSCRFQLKMGSHMNRPLQEDYNRLGESQFAFEILDPLEPKEDPTYDYNDELATLMSMWLEKLQPYSEKGYHTKAKPAG